MRGQADVAPAGWGRGGISYIVLYVIVRTLLRAFWHLRIEGQEHLPASGPYILVSNHPSELDPVLLSAAFPGRFAYLASRHLQDLPIIFWFIRRFGRPVWVQRGLGDLGAIKACLARLAAGDILVIFPEGRVVQADRLGPFHSGAAFLAIKGDVPVVPVALLGPAQMLPLGVRWPRPARLRIRVGAPLHQPTANGADAATFTTVINDAIERLLGELGNA